ncbi:hypothetical protein SAMN05421504_103365 [Amycolatopsis xylanica]|uniref:Uncharacterized protein n=1 Tax=Amycolatopsis xylanica TaxID=589385 RepID=A0A1H3DFN2_9PSEU|nr:hypothetical protein [Amycolatopsis xylanica]SDX64948.1 hypothetical protein SAMN05421504_103365 [Amycolatopsis xylanica]
MGERARDWSWSLGTLLALLGVCVAVFVVTGAQRGKARPHTPITRSEAEALFDRAVRLGQAGDVDGLCRSVAATVTNCEGLASSARDAHRAPGPEKPRIVGETWHAGERDGEDTRVLHVEGVNADGRAYRSDFAVIRNSPDAFEVRSLTAVYWSGVRFQH